MRDAREAIAARYTHRFRSIDEIELPAVQDNRVNAWHLYPIRLNLRNLKIGRDLFINKLQKSGIGCSVHWKPLHLHPYYRATFGWMPEDCPVASREWERLISLPLFPSMTDEEQESVIEAVKTICLSNRV
jgi:perosamine synthetase